MTDPTPIVEQVVVPVVTAIVEPVQHVVSQVSKVVEAASQTVLPPSSKPKTSKIDSMTIFAAICFAGFLFVIFKKGKTNVPQRTIEKPKDNQPLSPGDSLKSFKREVPARIGRLG